MLAVGTAMGKIYRHGNVNFIRGCRTGLVALLAAPTAYPERFGRDRSAAARHVTRVATPARLKIAYMGGLGLGLRAVPRPAPGAAGAAILQ